MKTLSIQKTVPKLPLMGIMHTNFYNIHMDNSFDIFLLLMCLFDPMLILQISLYFYQSQQLLVSLYYGQ